MLVDGADVRQLHRACRRRVAVRDGLRRLARRTEILGGSIVASASGQEAVRLGHARRLRSSTPAAPRSSSIDVAVSTLPSPHLRPRPRQRPSPRTRNPLRDHRRARRASSSTVRERAAARRRQHRARRQRSQRQLTDEEGRFRLSGAPAGCVTLVLTPPGAAPLRVDEEVLAGRHRDVLRYLADHRSRARRLRVDQCARPRVERAGVVEVGGQPRRSACRAAGHRRRSAWARSSKIFARRRPGRPRRRHRRPHRLGRRARRHACSSSTASSTAGAVSRRRG